MKLQQLSVFLENRRGRLKSVCNALAATGINMTTLTVADTQQFGILRLIVEDWQQAKNVLEQAGAVVRVTDVVAVEVQDRPGGLAHVLTLIENAGVSVEYMYAFSKAQENAILIFSFDHMDDAIAALQEGGIGIVTREQFFQQAAE